LNVRILRLIATVIDYCGPPREGGRGHPPAETVRVLATLRRFLREGTPWRSLTAAEAQVSGSALRRWLARWAETGVLAQVHAVLVGMLRGHPDLILDSCSVRAKRAGDLTGPNPTDRAKRGTKYNVAVDGDGVPVACVATAANVNECWSLSACSWLPSRSWPGSGRCSPIRATTPSIIAICAASSVSRPGSIGEASHPDRDWASGAGL